MQRNGRNNTSSWDRYHVEIERAKKAWQKNSILRGLCEKAILVLGEFQPVTEI